jgi:hypothetical protein
MLLRVDAVFARAFSLFEPCRVLLERCGPEAAVFDQYIVPFAASWIELNRIPRHHTDVAVANG